MYPVSYIPSTHNRALINVVDTRVLGRLSGGTPLIEWCKDLRVHATHRGEFIALGSGVNYCTVDPVGAIL